MTKRILALALFFLAIPGSGFPGWDVDSLEGLEWREIGPYRGGRSAAVAGIPDDRETYYFGATGGGVWKTENGGGHWENVSDGFFGGSIGAVAVSSWDPNVIYVGTGEKTIRGNVSHGDGMWKSTDAGKTWSHIGLDDSRHISRIRIHPKNPDLVYAAVMGHLFGPNPERGIYRSKNGGENWERILFANEQAGAVDLVMDPGNPRILYATTWRVLRTPYSLESGGEGSGLWKSTDGGDNWASLSENRGMPKPPLGISGITVSPSNPDNVYAIIEAAEGGVFRSGDGGETWTRVNQERKLRQRAWYYTRINADPADEDVLYVSNVRFHKSKDGGKSFEAIDTPHGDNHDLWIDPNDPLRMVQSNDGGANVSYDGGRNWSTQANQPTAQMYRVSADNAFPWRLLGGQQDNSAVRIRTRSATGAAISTRDWEPTAGGESGHIVADPDNPDIVYGGSYGGFLLRIDHSTGDRRLIDVWPDNPMGWGASKLKYRFNWNFPLMFSPHEADTLYAAGNVLFKSTDEGQIWTAISPDLTRNDKSKQQSSGGTITKDNTGVEYYGTIFALAESLHEPGVIWTGSDDGLVHLTRDGGINWSDVTPRGLPENAQVNSIEAHPFEKGGLYLAATSYKSDDFAPYLYRTSNYGRTWKKITSGIPEDEFTRVIRTDKQQRGLLFAGTERGAWFSVNDGKAWKPLQFNLPVVPVTDILVKEGSLAVATQGRGFWLFDDLALLRQAANVSPEEGAVLFRPAPAFRLQGRTTDKPVHQGRNPAAGVALHYWLPEALSADQTIELSISDDEGNIIRTFTRKPEEGDESKTEGPDDDRLLSAEKGLNSLQWNMRYPGVRRFEGLVLWNDFLVGPLAVPGSYSARLQAGEDTLETTFDIAQDPRSTATAADLQQQFDFGWSVNRKLTETHETIAELRDMRSQVSTILERILEQESFMDLAQAGDAIIEKLDSIEKALYQTKLEARQDPLNFPIRLNDKLASVMLAASIGDHPPTASAILVRDKLFAAIDVQLEALKTVLDDEVDAFNALAAKLRLSAVAKD